MSTPVQPHSSVAGSQAGLTSSPLAPPTSKRNPSLVGPPPLVVVPGPGPPVVVPSPVVVANASLLVPSPCEVDIALLDDEPIESPESPPSPAEIENASLIGRASLHPVVPRTHPVMAARRVPSRMIRIRDSERNSRKWFGPGTGCFGTILVSPRSPSAAGPSTGGSCALLLCNVMVSWCWSTRAFLIAVSGLPRSHRLRMPHLATPPRSRPRLGRFGTHRLRDRSQASQLGPGPRARGFLAVTLRESRRRTSPKSCRSAPRCRQRHRCCARQRVCNRSCRPACPPRGYRIR